MQPELTPLMVNAKAAMAPQEAELMPYPSYDIVRPDTPIKCLGVLSPNGTWLCFIAGVDASDDLHTLHRWFTVPASAVTVGWQ